MKRSAGRYLRALKTNKHNYFNMYTVDYFINKFEAIADKLWSTKIWNHNGICCAAGHCGVTSSIQLTPEALGLMKVLEPLISDSISPFSEVLRTLSNITRINDGKDSRYMQLTPKDRILTALRDVKKLQESKLYSKDATADLLALAQSAEKADSKEIITAKKPEIIHG